MAFTRRWAGRRAPPRLVASSLVASSLLALCGCSYQAPIPPVDGYNLAGPGKRQPGQFAALVQSDGWPIKVDVEGLACSLHTYKVDVEPRWVDAMKSALTSSLGTVDFVPAIVPPTPSMPYDAQIGVVQSGASAHVAVSPLLLGATARVETTLKGALTIVYPDGSFQYDTIEGSGSASTSGLGCEAASEAIGTASANALREVVREVATATKSLLAQHRAEHREATPPA